MSDPTDNARARPHQTLPELVAVLRADLKRKDAEIEQLRAELEAIPDDLVEAGNMIGRLTSVLQGIRHMVNHALGEVALDE